MSSSVELIGDHQPGELPLFQGVEQLVGLVEKLYQRPAFRDDPPDGKLGRRRRRARRGLPMLCLIDPAARATLLSGLSKRLAEADRGPVPHCGLRLPDELIIADDAGNAVEEAHADQGKPDAGTVEVQRVREILASAAQGLGSSRNAKGGRIRFRRFGLLNWLMSQDPGQGDSAEQSKALRKTLRDRDVTQRLDDAITSVGGAQSDLPGWVKNLKSVLNLIPPLLFMLRVTGRVPLIGPQYRWFLRQPHVTPKASGGFLGFAERLTKGKNGWPQEDKEQLKRLLANAFLEDLRRAWKSPWRIGGPRRMTYAVLLLHNITQDNGGFTLLQLINDVRNEVGLSDPLLLISAGTKAPLEGGPDEIYAPIDANSAHRTWRRKLPDARRARTSTAWYLRLRLPEAPSTAEDAVKISQRLVECDQYKVSGPPWWGRRVVPVGAVIVLLAGVVTGYVAWSDRHCGEGWRWPAAGSALTWTADQCIGVTDGHYVFDPALAGVTERILDQNERAEQAYHQDPTRTYVTVVDLQSLTAPPGGTDGLAAERQSLEGVAVAQAQAFQDLSMPLIRLLIGNGGTGMAYGTTVASQLRALPPTDAPLVGVVGLDQSTQATDNTVLALAIDGLPTIGASLSEDQLSNSNPLYYQVSPQNQREAAVAAAFANTLRESGRINDEVEVYYPDDANDTYAQNLTDDVVGAFEQAGFHSRKTQFAPSATPPAAIKPGVLYPLQNGKNACDFPGLVYYAGDGVPDFNAFLDGIRQCASPPALLADDDVTRYVADNAAREQNQSMPFWYTSFAAAPTSTTQRVAGDFYDGPVGLYSLFPRDQDKNEDSTLDGHAALSYDATKTLTAAVMHLRLGNTSIPMTPGDVWREISAIRSSTPTDRNPHPNNDVVHGVTGTIDFGSVGGNLHYPANKQISILLVQQGEVKSLAFFCGAPEDSQQSKGCPVDQE